MTGRTLVPFMYFSINHIARYSQHYNLVRSEAFGVPRTAYRPPRTAYSIAKWAGEKVGTDQNFATSTVQSKWWFEHLSELQSSSSTLQHATVDQLLSTGQ